MGDGIRKETEVVFIADTRSRDCSDFRRPGRGYGIVWQLYNIELRGFRNTESTGEEGEFTQRSLSIVLRGLLAIVRGVDMNIRRRRNRRAEFTSNDRPGESRFCPVEIMLLASGSRSRGGWSAAYDTVPARQCDMNVGGETVGHVTNHWKPATRI